jgi:uncharacterized SAM-binding protein YcdF (DUF218 family)
MGLGLLVLGASSFTSLGFLLIRPLEERFDRPATLPSDIAAIVMLGGVTAGRVSSARGIAELMEAGDRLTETLRLAQLYPGARIVLSGGVGFLNADGEPEAVTAHRFFTSMGVAEDRLILEAESRNTDENADLTARVLGQDSGAVLLVTSAFHMPRSVGLFRAAGVGVTPWPVDYRGTGNEGFGFDFVNLPSNLNTTGVAFREWIGLAAYKLTGRIADLFPRP